VAEVEIDNQDSIRGDNLGDPDLAAPGEVDDVNPGQAEHSAEPSEAEQAEHSAEPTEHSAKPPKVRRIRRSVEEPRRQSPKMQPTEKKDNVVQLSAQRGMVFEKSRYKRSRKRPGFLIRRMPGYSIAETEYGVSYLWVVSRKPDRTTADNSVHPLAGYFNWKALEASGLLCKERKNDKREKSGTAAIAG
jgi:hypothetical protein